MQTRSAQSPYLRLCKGIYFFRQTINVYSISPLFLGLIPRASLHILGSVF